ncbi:hypothetical protein PM082_009747 [Marasmius tenuissimus]|nr:hypothetical protein PM082_009747 [Marasmius tenuissimus]
MTTLYPEVLSPINRADPSVVYGNDPRSRFAPHLFATISPEDRQVNVSDTLSTIFQFRAVDFGMEICELRVSIPQQSSDNPAALVLPSSILEFYRLDQKHQLYSDTLSYSTRPRRHYLLARLHLEYGMEWGHRFSCTMDELLIFELTCPLGAHPGTCDVSWWQDRDSPSPGLFLVQHSSR